MSKTKRNCDNTLSVGPKTTAKELAEMIMDQHSLLTNDAVERAIRIYGKFQAKSVRDQAIEYLLENQDDYSAGNAAEYIQNINPKNK